MTAWVLYGGVLPEVFLYGQFVIYFAFVGRSWYSCYIRKWAHSYMLDYTQKILNSETKYCPRCFSPIKTSHQEYIYEKKIGETETVVYYSNGDVQVIREPIMSKEKETLPHLVCKEKSCSLGSKTQKDSAQSTKVKNQIKENYAFCEMPRSLNKVYRLIAGDRQDYYRKSMAQEMCLEGFWSRILVLIIILALVSYVKGLKPFSGISDYLFESTSSVISYVTMLLLLTFTYILFIVLVNIKTKAIMNSKKFKDEDEYFEDLKYDIYLTKRLAEIQSKERKKQTKKARKEGKYPNNSPSFFTDRQWDKRKNKYRDAISKIIKCTLENFGYCISHNYYNHCYILRAHADSANMPDIDFFISKNNCFVRGSTRFNYGVHQEYIEKEIATVLQNNSFNNLIFYVDKDLICSRVSFGLLASPILDTGEINESAIKGIISHYIETISVILHNTSPKVLADIPPEYMKIRDVTRNGFTLE